MHLTSSLQLRKIEGYQSVSDYKDLFLMLDSEGASQHNAVSGKCFATRLGACKYVLYVHRLY